MRAGVEPERVIAGVALILLAVPAAIVAGVALLAAPFVASLPVDLADVLLKAFGLAAFAIAQTVLAIFVMSGRHGLLALGLATGLVALATVVVGIGQWTPFLVGSLAICAIALLIGSRRRT